MEAGRKLGLTGVELGSALGDGLFQTNDLRSFRQVTSSPQVALPCSMCWSETPWKVLTDDHLKRRVSFMRSLRCTHMYFLVHSGSMSMTVMYSSTKASEDMAS